MQSSWRASDDTLLTLEARFLKEIRSMGRVYRRVHIVHEITFLVSRNFPRDKVSNGSSLLLLFLNSCSLYLFSLLVPLFTSFLNLFPSSFLLLLLRILLFLSMALLLLRTFVATFFVVHATFLFTSLFSSRYSPVSFSFRFFSFIFF